MKPRRSPLHIILALVLLLFMTLSGCKGCRVTSSWPNWRSSQFRDGLQLFETVLNDAGQVSTLHVVWTFNDPGPRGFRGSAVVDNDGNVYIGDNNGYFYRLSAATGQPDWRYPPQGQPGLVQQFDSCDTCNMSGWGIASSGALTYVGNTRAVIFGAPDPKSGAHFGDGHLFALNAANGQPLWESPALALVTGLNSGNTNEFHQQIGYSAPLIFNDHAYVGVADHMDDPIQKGHLIAVKLSDGSIDNNFSFDASSTRGGGIWGSAAAWDDVFVTTGNTRCDAAGCQSPEPANNYGLSMLRLNKDTGHVVWQHQPVPYDLDNDPDWAAGPAVMYSADCGPAIVSAQKDGWTWAVHAGTGAPGAPGVMWAFPPGPWTTGGFHSGDGTVHSDDDYKRPGATWGDVYIGVMGGWDTQTDLSGGYVRVHALNVCSSDTQRVRWLKDISGSAADPFWNGTYPLGPPTVTVDGMVFIATNRGHLIAIADPTLHPALGNRCEDPAIASNQCQGQGKRLVPDPWIQDIALPGAPNDGIFGEPAIANGRIYVATISGHVYMLQP